MKRYLGENREKIVWCTDLTADGLLKRTVDRNVIELKSVASN